MLCGLLIEATGIATWGFITSFAQAFLVTTIVSCGGSAIWAPQSALLARVAPAEHRQRVFGLNFMLLNAGLGTGGFVAALLVQEGVESSYQRLYLLNGVSYLFYFFVILSMRHIRGPEVHHEELQGSYREVFQDRRIVKLSLAGLAMIISGYSSIEAGLAIFTTTVVDLPPNALGVIFGVNTFCIFTLQALILKKIQGHSRTRLLGLVGVLWCTSWSVVALSVPTTGAVALVLLSISQFIFAIGEMLWSPIMPSIANDIAPPHMRGRYNALISLQWGVANSIGPLLVALLFGRGQIFGWLALLMAGSLLSGLVLNSLRSSLTAEQDGRSEVAA